MKFAYAFSFLVSVVGAAVDITPESVVGRNLLSHARRLDGEFSDAWLSGYSIKFQGCHTIKQWNAAADERDDVRIYTKSLVRFRMCPTDSCSSNKAAGCSSGYGDYIVDMNDFMDAWYEASRQDTEYKCWAHLQNNCNCDEENNQADDFNKEYCEYDCYNDAGLAKECTDRNPYAEEEQGKEEFKVEEYMSCNKINVQNQNRRELNNNNNKYYVGPVCAGQGGDIYLGLFSDDTCTTVPEDVTYYSLTGSELPYSNTSIVTSACVTCLEHKEEDNKQQQEGGAADADQVSEACEGLYLEAGKCEAHYPEGMVATPNNNACTYMEGIKIIRLDGTIAKAENNKNGVATAFIVIFAMAFAGTFILLFPHYKYST